MIKKFIKISGTGKFLNYNHSSVSAPYRTTDFEKINLLYGENGSGKTTLSIIFKSLKDNNALLVKKRSFDRVFPQIVEVLTDVQPTPKITYANNAWDKFYPNLEIFDIYFINENIYTGLEIQNTHKKNLFELIFGQEGVQLKEDIQQVKERIQNNKTLIREATEKIELAIDKAYNAIDYGNLPVDAEINSKILAKESELITAKSFQEIQAKPVLTAIPIFNPPYESEIAIKTIGQSIDNITETYLRKITEHKLSLSMDGKAEEWIKKGYEAIKDNTCPFCLRPFDNKIEIIEAYKQYFNDEYNTLLTTLVQLDLEISGFNIESQFLHAEAKIAGNNNLIEFWGKHIQDPPELNTIIDRQTEVQTAFEAVRKIFKEKSLNPIHNMDTKVVEDFQSILDAINAIIKTYNSRITAYNALISQMKAGNQPNIIQLEIDLKKLRAIKKKEDTGIATLCTNLMSYNQATNELNIQKTTKQQLLDAYSTTIFTNYTTKINQYLQSFAPYLEIRNLDSGYVGSSTVPMVKYALHVNGNEVKPEDSATHPSFKYTFSEGDKSALALAFFLTKLEIDGNIQDKIVVFDDPVSSFDLNRKSTTINRLIDIGRKAKQLFVLTHNINFACDFWKSANQLPFPSQCSKIELLGNTSCVVEFYIDAETLSSILKDSTAIMNYLSSGCPSDQEKRGIARCLRPALESYFHLKFFDLVSPTDWLGDFIAKVRESNNSTDRFYRLQSSLAELTAINDYSKKYHHRSNNQNESEPINDAELRTFCDSTLKLIQLI